MELLDELAELCGNEKLPEKEKILIFDGNNIAFKNLFADIYANPEDNEFFYLWRHQMLNDIFDKIKMFSPTKVIIAFDQKNSWRYGIYKYYKSNRKSSRDNSKIDFEKFFPIFDDFKSDIEDKLSNIYVIDYPQAEGDDIVAVLAKHLSANEVIVISSDKDFNQLLVNKNIKKFDPIKKKSIESINPELQLQIQILTGDKDDGIPPIRPRVGVKTAEKILNEGLEEFLQKEENKELIKIYNRNKTLIDFNCIPNDLSKNIINTFTNYEIKELDSLKILKFFTKHKLVQIMKRWKFEIYPIISKLK